MGKYANWAELERNVPLSYREGATPESFRSGMQGIAPSGMTVKEDRVKAYGQGVDGKAEVMVERYRRAMFE
jgi:hypothetical protein